MRWYDLRKNCNDLPKTYDIIRKSFGIYEQERSFHIVLNQDGEEVFYLLGNWYYTGETGGKQK